MDSLENKNVVCKTKNRIENRGIKKRKNETDIETYIAKLPNSTKI